MSIIYIYIGKDKLIVREPYIEKDIAITSVNKDIDKIFKRPSTCIFGNETICMNKSCNGIDWKNPLNATDECKKVVNSYCRKSSGDSGCQSLKIWKQNQIKEKNQARLEHPSISIDKDCKSCTSKVDLSKFAMVK
jgi:hypothetical protein